MVESSLSSSDLTMSFLYSILAVILDPPTGLLYPYNPPIGGLDATEDFEDLLDLLDLEDLLDVMDPGLDWLDLRVLLDLIDNLDIVTLIFSPFDATEALGIVA